VLDSNAIADVLFHDWQRSGNLMQVVLADPDGRTFHCD
jgi:hypothetical protein